VAIECILKAYNDDKEHEKESPTTIGVGCEDIEDAPYMPFMMQV
jgi:hypothetical protein